MKTALQITAAALLTAWSVASGRAQGLQVDPALPPYRPVQGVSGSIASVGSDTMNNLMTLWSEGFRAHYPNVRVEIEGKGSSTAPPALIAGTANFGPMSRAMKGEELDAFEEAHGYKPTELPAGIDMLVVYVNKDNPVESLTLQEVDAIFSRTRKGGADAGLRTWGQVGAPGRWAGRVISLYGRNSASGTYGFFKQHALFRGDFKDEVKEQPGSSAVVQGVSTDLPGIGYSGVGYRTADVKALALAPDAASAPVPATPRHAYSGEYPLSRFLYLYVNVEPHAPLEPLRREFIRYIFSREGQQDVLRAGYYPITAEIAWRTLASVGIRSDLDD